MNDRQFEEAQEQEIAKREAIVAKATIPFPQLPYVVGVFFDESLYPITEEQKPELERVLEAFYSESEENMEKFKKGLTYNEVDRLLNKTVEVEGPVHWKLLGDGEGNPLPGSYCSGTGPLQAAVKKFEDYVDEYRKGVQLDVPAPTTWAEMVAKALKEARVELYNKKEREMENITEKQAKAVYGDLKSNENNRQVVTEGLAHATFKGDTFTRTSPSNSQLVQVEVPVGSMITTDIPQGTGSTSEHYVYCDPTPAGVAPFPSYQDDEAFYETPDDILLDRFYVFTPRGVVKARIVGTEINHRLGCVQYIVETKLPKGVRLHNGSKWIVEDYYYCWDELYATIEDAIDSI